MFSVWVKRATVLSTVSKKDMDMVLRVAKAAYKAGQREGEKDAQTIAERAVMLRDAHLRGDIDLFAK